MFFLFDNSTNGQCITTNSTCFLTGSPINLIFPNTTLGVSTWQVSDINGVITQELIVNNTTWTPTIAGQYIIKAGYGPPNNPSLFSPVSGCSPLTIIVADNPPTLNVLNPTINICSGDSVFIATAAGISFGTAPIGPATYTWTTSNGVSYSSIDELSTPIVLTTETSVTLSITDITGCVISEIININYNTTPSPTPNFTMSTPSCAGDSVTFTANNPNPSYNYNWYINNQFFTGSSITTNFQVFTPNQSQDFEIILYTDDLSSVCPIYDIQTLTIPPTQFVILDTTVGPSWSTNQNAFYGCENYPYDIVLYNNFPGPVNTAGINSLDIQWIHHPGSATSNYTTTQTNNFDSILGTINTDISHILITTNTATGCANTVRYDLNFSTYNLQSIASSIGKLCASECIGEPVKFYFPPSSITVPVNAQLRWIIRCTDYELDTVYWDYNDYIASQQNVDISPCDQPTNIQLASVFSYQFPKSSCDCDDIQYPGYYQIDLALLTVCDTIPAGEQKVQINPNPSTNFVIPNALCEGSTISIVNNSFFGCDPSDNNFNPADSVYFSYNFGDSCSTVTIDTVSSSFNFNPITHTYNAGSYTIKLIASNVCTADTVEQAIDVRPKPELYFLAENVCYGSATEFLATQVQFQQQLEQ